ncbi:hypothetical protein GCM10010909_06380 [Acidocella aquatica]|uniref:Uncharacterized protein n=1 Tax=Acidocella aquatica TaxID=1922313 RepID=A0ABQ6A7B0_9PROT|nr:hypothetical protein [Acidocella aquatica]GLR65960.1 hypothetical protein GCM10010909_06380 [Acidocella aquatica]
MAGTPNPYYDPDWEQKYRKRAAISEKWRFVCARIAARDGFGAPRHLRALAQHEQAKALEDAARRGQFRSVADYAAWRFATLPPAREGVAALPDFEGFRSVEAVDAAFWRVVHQEVETPLIDAMSLPVRQPAGLAAFVPARDVLSSWRRFSPAELSRYPAGMGAEPVDCLVSFHQLGNEFHICIAHRWGRLSPRSRDQFRNIATLLARQTIEVLHPGVGMIFTEGRHAAPQYRDLLRQVNAAARRFHFYRHLLPRRDLKEQFGQVAMGWDGARFIDPDFEAVLYDALPEALRAAAENAGGAPLNLPPPEAGP